MNNAINYIESNGFQVKGRYIYKRSSSTNKLETAGYINDDNFFFFSENVHPFKAGVNLYEEETLVNPSEIKNYIAKAKENERNDFNVSFEKYIDTTKRSSVFGDWLQGIIREWKSENAVNYYDIRGIAKGYMTDSVAFPFFDYNGNFITAQIIRYNENGKRLKSRFSTNWYHTYKSVKTDLGLKESDKYTIQNLCFFGENYLNGSNNPVAIVEAPKTAVILKELYPNIDWIATAGEQTLFNKDLSVLEGKDIILFPDAHSPKWGELAKKKNWKVCSLLDIESIGKGDDIADYIFNSEHEIFSDLHEFLFSLNAGYYDFEVDSEELELDFFVKGNDSSHLAILPLRCEGQNIVHKEDNSSEVNLILKGNYFNIYDEEYSVLNANVDFHKRQRKNAEGDLEGFNKDEFVWHLQKTYRTLIYLNKGKEALIKKAYKHFLNGLLKHSNFSFNTFYVMKVLIPLWDSYSVDINKFKKKRNWKYIKKEKLPRSEFPKQLHNDNFRAKMFLRLQSFNDALKENRFIEIETDLALNSNEYKRGYSKIVDLVKEWNEKVIGAKTIKTYLNNLELKEKVNDFISCTKNIHPHIENSYKGVEKMYNSYSLSELSRILEVKNRKTLKDFFTFKKDNDTETLTKKEVKLLLENINEITPVRMEVNGKKKITDFIYKPILTEQELITQHKLNAKDAFLPLEKLVTMLKNEKDEIVREGLLFDINYLKALKEMQKKNSDKLINLVYDSLDFLDIPNEKQTNDFVLSIAT